MERNGQAAVGSVDLFIGVGREMGAPDVALSVADMGCGLAMEGRKHLALDRKRHARGQGPAEFRSTFIARYAESTLSREYRLGR